MTQYRFTFINRQDGKMGIWSPEARQSIVIYKAEFGEAFKKMFMGGYPEIMPNLDSGLGISFGTMSKTAWIKFARICKKLGAEITT